MSEPEITPAAPRRRWRLVFLPSLLGLCVVALGVTLVGLSLTYHRGGKREILSHEEPLILSLDVRI